MKQAGLHHRRTFLPQDLALMRSFPHGRALALALTLYPTDAAVEDFYCGREPGFAEVNTYLNGVSRCLRSGAKVWFSFTEMYGEDCVLYCFYI